MTNQTIPSATTVLVDDFRTFASAALKIGGHLLQGMSPEQEQDIENALRGGARFQLEFGPLPAFESVRLVLVEAEGARHPLTSVSINRAPPHANVPADAQDHSKGRAQ